MARILLVDPSEMAQRAMRGILARGNHRCACVNTALEGWDFIRQNVRVDLVFTELPLSGGIDGLAFVKQLKADCLLKFLPVVIYTSHGDREAVKRGLDLRVQNFLVKPFHDEDVFAEIDKSDANPWRNRHFEEEKSFCRMMGFTPEQVRRMLADLQGAVDTAVASLHKWAALEAGNEMLGLLQPLIAQGESAGAWGMVESLNGLAECIRQGSWSHLPAQFETIAFAGRLIAHRLDDTCGPDSFLSETEQHTETEKRERARWRDAVLAGQHPVIDLSRLQREIDALPGCPVIDTSAASFQMAANGHPSCINPLMDLVDRDPGLAAQMLIAANQAHPAGENDNIIEDPRLAVGMLGETKLEQQARRLVQARARFMDLPPHLNWSRFWMFQTAVGRVAQYTCHYLEFYSMESQARMAGLLHDLGKLILLHLQPMGFQTIVEYAHEHRVPLAETERLFLGCTSHEIGARFATRCQLSPHYTNVMRWIDNPEAATEDACLVAIVSLARDLCRHLDVGAAGDPILDQRLPLNETPEWRVLSDRLFPSFNLREFELQVHAYCQQMRLEFSGKPGRYASERAFV